MEHKNVTIEKSTVLNNLHAQLVAQVANAELEKLTIKNLYLSKKNMDELVSIVSNHKSLNELILEDTKSNDKYWKLLAKALEQNTIIKNLTLSNVNIHACVSSFADILKKNKNLEVVKINPAKPEKITDEDKAYITDAIGLAKCSKLRITYGEQEYFDKWAKDEKDNDNAKPKSVSSTIKFFKDHKRTFIIMGSSTGISAILFGSLVGAGVVNVGAGLGIAFSIIFAGLAISLLLEYFLNSNEKKVEPAINVKAAVHVAKAVM